MRVAVTVLVLGLLASLSPSTIVVFILLLATTRARVNAAAFLIGWTISLVIVFALSYLLGSARSTQHGGGRLAVEVIETLLGVALVVAAARQWQRRDRPRTSSGLTKRLTARLRDLNPFEAAIVGVLEQPWTLTAAVAVVLVRNHEAFVAAVIAFALFTVASTATVGFLYLYYSRNPGEAQTRLAELRDRVVRAGPTLFVVVSLVVGSYLVVDGIVGIVGG